MRHSTGTFESVDGHPMFEQHWLPDGPARADLVIVHGYAEHSGRYEHVGAYFAERGVAVRAYDLRGHGCSGGERVLVRSFDEHLEDLETFIAGVRDPDRPLFLLGHSMGGGIVALHAAERRPDVRGVLLSGAVLSRPGGLRGLIAGVLVLAGRAFPKWKLGKLDAATVSRDPAVVAKYDADPLVYRDGMYAGTLSAMMRAVGRIRKRVARIDRPLLIMHGTADALVSPDGSRWLYAHAGSRDKTLKLYDGLYHEILNEPEQREVMGDIAAWMDARAG
ncbi:MAG TPA: alpha/beta hydrolase [Dehalococcoidia bacterium]|nr:alpha/beta hydrolase [Dehalococcoidia bacterium]